MSIGYTPYSQANQRFSNKAHARAQTALYPLLFGCDKDQLEFKALPEDQARTLDGDMGTDRLVEVSVKGLLAPLTFLVQERFRRSENANYPDVTVTEWNYNSNLPSELYKIKAGLFLYGKYNETLDQFTEAIAFSVCPMLLQLANGNLPYRRNRNKKNQTFLCIKIADLDRLHITNWRYKWGGGAA